MRNLSSFKTSLKFEPPAFENAARYPKSETKVQCCDDSPTHLVNKYVAYMGFRLVPPTRAISAELSFVVSCFYVILS